MELVVSQIINGISGSAELFLVAIGLVITFGMLDVVNMAHGEMIMLGAYFGCVFVNSLHLPFAVEVILLMISARQWQRSVIVISRFLIGTDVILV